MHPKTVTKLQALVVGGESRGTKISLHPASLGELSQFFKEASSFLATGRARMLEITMYNAEGKTALRQMYAEQGVFVDMYQDIEEESDPFSRFG